MLVVKITYVVVVYRLGSGNPGRPQHRQPLRSGAFGENIRKRIGESTVIFGAQLGGYKTAVAQNTSVVNGLAQRLPGRLTLDNDVQPALFRLVQATEGVKAVLAESYERIHRSNLVGMGVLPLQFNEGENLATHGLTGRERFDIEGIHDGMKPGAQLKVTAHGEDGGSAEFQMRSRIDTRVEVDYYRNGGILQTVLRQMISA
ncbi:MAG: hypothetical protein IIA41_05555 [SAR324 cluster bacterium]|nr:hypothetical protein [SAR324 cluster bacterium]